MVIEDKEQFAKLQQDQPMSQAEKNVIHENTLDDEKTRLSCQIFVMEYFKDITFCIE